MKFCFCTLAFRDTPLSEILPRISEMGYDGVEIFAAHLKGMSRSDLEEVRATAASLNLSIEVVSPYFWLTQTPELLDESMGIAEDTISKARILGCPKIRTFTDAGPTGIGSGVATVRQWATAIDVLRTITGQAPEIDFVVETHEKTLADTASSAVELLARTGASNLKILFQTMNPGSMLADFDILYPNIRHVHLQNHDGEGNHTSIESGELDLGMLLRHAAGRGYRNSVSVEYCKGATWEQAASAIKWLRSLGLERE